MLRFSFLAVFFFISFFAQAQNHEATVVRIKDGDTFVLRTTEGQMIDVRLSGIDCPERGQPFGDESTQFVAPLLFQKVTFKGIETDRYGRLVAEVFHKNQSINHLLVAEGYAWHFREYSTDGALACAEYEARAAKKGLWASAHSIYPKCWRKGQDCAPASTCGQSQVVETSAEVMATSTEIVSSGSDNLQEYFMCNSSGSVAYHINGQCKGLTRCTHEIVKLSAKNAEARGKHACKMCTAGRH